MKKRFFTGLVLGAMMMGALTGCGKTNEVEKSEKKSANTEVVQSADVEVDNTEEATETVAMVDATVTEDAEQTDDLVGNSDVTEDSLAGEPVYNLGQSSVFTEEQLEYGADYVVATFGTYFPECELLDVTYDDSFSSSQDEINKQQYGEADYVVFTTDFIVSADYTDGPLNAGETYEDYQWILTMNAEGQWELVSSGWQ